VIKTKHKYHFFLLIIIISSLSFKLYYIERHPTFTDEILSAIVSQSIAQNGIPRLPSNSIYPRALLHHYLSAIPIGLMGINYFSMRINPILFSLLTIWVIYLLGVRVANRRVGIAAAFLLAINAIFNQYSLSGRMYMTYASFYVLSIYFFYRGFVEKETIPKALAILFMIATMLSSEAGLIIGPIFVFLLYCYVGPKWFKTKYIFLVSGIWLVFTYFILIYKLPDVYVPFTAQSGQLPKTLLTFDFPIRLIIIKVSTLWRQLDKYIPLSVPFCIVMTIFVIKNKQLKEHFPLMSLLPALIVQSFFGSRVQSRIIVTILPLYIITYCQLILTLWNWVTVGVGKEISFNRFIFFKKKQIIGVVTLFILISVPFIIHKFALFQKGPPQYLYKPFYHDRSGINPQPAYLYLKNHVKRNEIVLQTTLEYGYFFLGDIYNYYYLRQKMIFDTNENIKYISFPIKFEPYYGRPIIDSLESLINLMANSQSKIWLILDVKSKWSLGAEIKEFIRDHFELKFLKNEIKVYSYSS
jgi:4-amino-4-deoxy-L-arabinose transferase-like glycosyltransferase